VPDSVAADALVREIGCSLTFAQTAVYVAKKEGIETNIGKYMEPVSEPLKLSTLIRSKPLGWQDVGSKLAVSLSG
jgi:hypothetical protein